MKLKVCVSGPTGNSQRESANFAAKIRVRSQCLRKTNWFLKAAERIVKAFVTRFQLYTLLCFAGDLDLDCSA